ncbi:MAG: hypothetical protein HQK75_10720 [Candidatus Magnetomorum sp.]|nr:hypothetical protein [Candidatus Magnetomorum sp.]MBF0451166.1 hypothetical protein [Candidatus Magnetomorum sp.]
MINKLKYLLKGNQGYGTATEWILTIFIFTVLFICSFTTSPGKIDMPHAAKLVISDFN